MRAIEREIFYIFYRYPTAMPPGFLFTLGKDVSLAGKEPTRRHPEILHQVPKPSYLKDIA